MNKPLVNFQCERLGTFLADASDQILQHWKELESFERRGWKLDINHDAYIELDHKGILKIITGRNQKNKIVAYVSCYVMKDLNSKSHTICTFNSYYLDPRYRGFTVLRMFKFVEKFVVDLGVEELNVSFRLGKNRMHDLFTKHLGYHPVDVVLRKRINIDV